MRLEELSKAELVQIITTHALVDISPLKTYSYLDMSKLMLECAMGELEKLKAASSFEQDRDRLREIDQLIEYSDAYMKAARGSISPRAVATR